MASSHTLEPAPGLASSLVSRLSPGTVASGAATLLVLYLIASSIYSVYFHPLAKFPGPKLWALSRLPYAYYLRKGKLPQHVKVFHDTYGKIVRIAPDELSFIEGAAWKAIYTPKPGHGPFEKWEVWLNRAVSGAYSILTAPTNHEHARIKRFLQHGFSDKAIRAQEELFKVHVNILVARVREAIAAGEPIQNMYEWFAFATSDIMGDLTFGESFGCLTERKNHRWISILIHQFTAVLNITCIRFFPVLHRLFQWYIPHSNILDRPREIHAYAVEKIKERMSKDVDRPDYTYYLQRENKDNDRLSRAEYETTLSALVVAGGETTASFLSGIVFHLVQHPRVLRKLEQEIRTAFKTDQDISAAETTKLPYFNACIKEGLRLAPAVPFGHPRMVRPEGDEVLGHQLPGGTKLALMAYGAYRSAINFKDPESFIPERWIDWNGYDDLSVYEPFSLGPRACLGKNMALCELRLILARVFYNFTMDLPPGQSDMGWHWGDQEIYLLWKCDPMVVKVADAWASDAKAGHRTDLAGIRARKAVS